MVLDTENLADMDGQCSNAISRQAYQIVSRLTAILAQTRRQFGPRMYSPSRLTVPSWPVLYTHLVLGQGRS